MSATGGQGVAVAFDPVGGALGEVTRRLMAWEGRLVVIGFASGGIPSYPANHVLVKNYAVLGMAWADYAVRRRPIVEAAHEELLALFRAGRIRTDVTPVPLADVPAALAALEARTRDRPPRHGALTHDSAVGHARTFASGGRSRARSSRPAGGSGGTAAGGADPGRVWAASWAMARSTWSAVAAP